MFLIYIVVYGFFFITNNQISVKAYAIVFSFFLIIDTIPSLILHFQYLFHEANAEISLSMKNKSLTYIKKGIQYSYKLDDITRFDYYDSFGAGTGFYSAAEYCFYKITFSDSRQIIVTVLRTPNFKKSILPLIQVKEEKNMRLFCFLPFIGKI